MGSLLGRSVGQSKGESLCWLVGLVWLFGRSVVRSVGLSFWFGFVRSLVGWSVGRWVGRVGLGSGLVRLVGWCAVGRWVVGCVHRSVASDWVWQLL